MHNKELAILIEDLIFQAPSWRLEEVEVLAKLRAANKHGPRSSCVLG
jgi:hypothetical protein